MPETSHYYAIRLRSKDMEVHFNTADTAFATEQLYAWQQAFTDPSFSINTLQSAASQALPSPIEVQEPVIDAATNVSTGFEQGVQNSPDPGTEKPEAEDNFDDFMDSLISSVDHDEAGLHEGLLNPLNPSESSSEAVPSAPDPAVAVLDRPQQAKQPSATENNQQGSLQLDFSMHRAMASLKALFEKAPHAKQEEDHLLLSAYYLSHVQGQNTVTLREMNTELIRSGFTPVNHAIVETAISGGLISLVPDLTGDAAMAEYALTESGLQTATALLTS